MRNCLLVWLILAGSGFSSPAVNNLRIGDNRSIGTGGNEVTQSLLFNPSLLTSSFSFLAGFQYYNQYGIKELNNYSFYGSFSNTLLPIGIHISSFGYDEYRESMFRGMLAKQLTRKFSIGISFQYTIIESEIENLSAQYLSTDIGLLYYPVEDLLIGLLIMDFPSFSLKDQLAENKVFNFNKLQIGFEWRFINNLFIMGTGEIGLSGGYLNSSIGLEYHLYDNFRIRTGVKINPSQLFLGIGYSFSSFTIDVTAGYHPILGISNGAGITYSF